MYLNCFYMCTLGKCVYRLARSIFVEEYALVVK